jgi:hypothetical protein
MPKALVNKTYTLQKIAGKGGWTYVVIPEIPQNKRAKFGWVTVRGTIDTYELKNYRLMPMGNGKLFLPVRAEIRKKINKQVGDTVKVVLFADNSVQEIPAELLLCLKDEPEAYKTFTTFTESEQRAYIHWIESAKKEETKVERIAKTINRVLLNKKFHDQDLTT